MSIIECPSGLVGKVRALSGRDGRYLTNQSLAKKGELLDTILMNCWEGTEEAGIYSPKSDGSLDWGDVLEGDRTFVLLRIQQEGSDEDEPYEFQVRCTDKTCGARIDWEVHLDELPVKLLSDESRAKLQAGQNRFSEIVPGTEERKRLSEVTFLDSEEKTAIISRRGAQRDPLVKVPGTGEEVFFKLLCGRDTKRAQRLAKQQKKNGKDQNDLVFAISQRIVEVSGGKTGANEISEYLEGMRLSDLAKLLDRLDSHDCGVDTVVSVACPECGMEQEHDLPFDEDFFFKRKARGGK